MKTIPEILARLNEKKAQLKVVRKQVKETLSGDAGWVDLNEKKVKVRADLKTRERLLVGEETYQRLQELTLAVRQDQQMLSDIAITAMLKGEQVAQTINGVEYEPQFKVSFKQLKLGI